MIIPRVDVSAIILAAGFSSRMGQFKPLIQIGGQTCISRAVSGLREAGVSDIIIVAGFMADKVIAEALSLGCRPVENKNFQKGMFSSVREGVRHISSKSKAFFVLPVDIPMIRPETFRKLIFSMDDKYDIAHPVFLGERGHPPLLAARLGKVIVSMPHDNALDRILEQNEARSISVKVTDEFTIMDIDTPEDLERMKERIRRDHIPSAKELVALFEMFSCPENVIGHGKRVTDVAELIAVEINEKEHNKIDIPLLKAAALLHDIAKGKGNHPLAGAALLRENGFSRVADIVETHQDLGQKDFYPIDEHSVLYLADKLVAGSEIISLEERFSRTLSKFSSDIQARNAVMKRYCVALKVRDEAELIIGRSLDRTFFSQVI